MWCGPWAIFAVLPSAAELDLKQAIPGLQPESDESDGRCLKQPHCWRGDSLRCKGREFCLRKSLLASGRVS